VNFPEVINQLNLRDHSVEPPREGAAYPVLVCNVDSDGNSVGGLRHPLLSAPLGTHTGWALRGPGYAEGDLYTVQGSYVPLAESEVERVRNNDPRRSIAARYGTREGWAEAVAAAAEELVNARVLLREDADRLISAARESGRVWSAMTIGRSGSQSHFGPVRAWLIPVHRYRSEPPWRGGTGTSLQATRLRTFVNKLLLCHRKAFVALLTPYFDLDVTEQPVETLTSLRLNGFA